MTTASFTPEPVEFVCEHCNGRSRVGRHDFLTPEGDVPGWWVRCKVCGTLSNVVGMPKRPELIWMLWPRWPEIRPVDQWLPLEEHR